MRRPKQRVSGRPRPPHLAVRPPVVRSDSEARSIVTNWLDHAFSEIKRMPPDIEKAMRKPRPKPEILDAHCDHRIVRLLDTVMGLGDSPTVFGLKKLPERRFVLYMAPRDRWLGPTKPRAYPVFYLQYDLRDRVHGEEVVCMVSDHYLLRALQRTEATDLRELYAQSCDPILALAGNIAEYGQTTFADRFVVVLEDGYAPFVTDPDTKVPVAQTFVPRRLWSKAKTERLEKATHGWQRRFVWDHLALSQKEQAGQYD